MIWKPEMRHVRLYKVHLTSHSEFPLSVYIYLLFYSSLVLVWVGGSTLPDARDCRFPHQRLLDKKCYFGQRSALSTHNLWLCLSTLSKTAKLNWKFATLHPTRGSGSLSRDFSLKLSSSSPFSFSTYRKLENIFPTTYRMWWFLT